jgi:hypothetical protein
MKKVRNKTTQTQNTKQKETINAVGYCKELAFGVISEAGFGVNLPHLFLSEEEEKGKKFVLTFYFSV